MTPRNGTAGGGGSAETVGRLPEPEVPPKLAEERAAILRERQIAITHTRMDRFVGGVMDVLVEENVPGEPLAIGRCYAQAPEVDGAVVINTQTPLEPGTFVRCAIARRNGLDLEGVPL